MTLTPAPLTNIARSWVTSGSLATRDAEALREPERRWSRRQLLTGCAALGSSLALGCAPDFQIRRLDAPDGRRADVLVVFVTGFSDDLSEVVGHGVIHEITHQVGPVDTVVVQGETLQFFSGEFSAELDRRILETPWARAYSKRILIGFSGGGTAALRYVYGRPEAVDALVLYAPYLGPNYIVEEIEEAGGLAQWRVEQPRERQELLWLWLKRYGAAQIDKPPLHVMWSRQDEVAVGLPLLEDHLPKHRLFIGEGEHGWDAFDRMWPNFVRTHPEIFRA